ncbi:MAG: hypothetical protein HY959_02745 [Ignavibacteriae bacterium]|nr:hypothetical protein [Ignavibacteriota bacterium]
MKTPIKDIPAALKKWTEKPGDFWFGKCIRSLGYTRAELTELMKKNKEIDHAVKLAFDSLFEKVIYNIATGNLHQKVGDFIMLYYGHRLKIIKKRDAKDYYYDCPKNGDFNGLVDDDDDEDDCDDNEDSDENSDKKIENLNGEFGPLFKKIKIKNK